MIAQLFYLLLLAAIVIVQKPSLLFKTRWIAPILEKEGIHANGLRIESRSAGFLTPEIKISWKDLRIRTTGFHASSGPGRIDLTVNFKAFPPQVSRIDEIRIADVDAAVLPSTASSPAPTKETSKKGFSVPSWLRGAQVGDIDVDISSWRASGDQGSAQLRHFRAKPEMPVTWRWQLRASELLHHAHVDLAGSSASHTLYGPWTLQLNARASGISPQIHQAKIHDCKLTLTGSSRLAMNCPIQVATRLPRIREVPTLHFKDTVDAVFSAEISSSDLLDFDRRAHMKGNLQLKPILPLGPARDVGRIVGDVQLAGDFIPSDPAEKWNLRSTLDLELRIDRFHRLVRFLDTTRFAIPAPFASLKGQIVFAANGQVSMDQAKIPVRLQSRLHSPNQDFDLDAAGTFTVPRIKPTLHPRLDLTLTLTKLRIPLPHLDLGNFPQFLPDARITTQPPGREQRAGRVPPPSAFEYHIVVKTAGQPVKIQSNLAKSEVPVQLHLVLENGRKPQGTVHVDSFPLDLFRRNALLQSFQIDLGQKEEKISGMAQINYTDYTIYLKFFGTVDSPQITFLSNPPLSQADVISVLLFGQTSEDLDQSQSQSVGNVRSAVAARSLDLASMYLLASTPIESVGYDPESGTVSMRFRLTSGTSLQVTEGQQELQSLGIRHRLGSHWSITTQVGNPADPTDKSVSALFQWSHRY